MGETGEPDGRGRGLGSAPRVLDDARAGALEMLRRALRLRCPRCGRSALFPGWFQMHEQCAVCHLRYEREPGYFVGAIYVNYAATIGLGLGGVLLLDWFVDLPLWAELTLAFTAVALVPLVFFRYSRALWLALDHYVTTADERGQRRPRRR